MIRIIGRSGSYFDRNRYRRARRSPRMSRYLAWVTTSSRWTGHHSARPGAWYD